MTDRLNELQEQNALLSAEAYIGSIQAELSVHESNETRKRLNEAFETNERLLIQRDEARAQVEFLKEAHAKCRQYLATALDKLENQSTKMTRPEPSRLEIAAMLKAGSYACQDINPLEANIALKQADALIAAAKEAK